MWIKQSLYDTLITQNRQLLDSLQETTDELIRQRVINEQLKMENDIMEATISELRGDKTNGNESNA